MKNTVTMEDIAKEIGVSIVTVSKAISGKEGVSDKVRADILECAERMGYQYNKVSNLSKRTGRNYNIGVVIPERFVCDDTFYNRLYKDLVLRIGEKGHYTMIEIIPEENEHNLLLPNVIVNKKVDAVIVFGQMSETYVEKMRESGLPLLLFDFYLYNSTYDCVVSDSVFGSWLLTKYLIDRGHREIGFVGSIDMTTSIMDRYLGYMKAMLEAKIDIEKQWVMEDRDSAGRYIEIKLPDKMPSAFVCNCDEVAFLLIKRLKHMGYRVPEDISVVGFDNDFHAQLSSPQITSFGIDVKSMVKIAADTIVKKIENPEYRIGRQVVSGKIYERKSVKSID